MTLGLLQDKFIDTRDLNYRSGVNQLLKELAFPRIHEEQNEKRDFLPSLFKKISKMTEAKIFLEKGYGHKMGISEEEYLKADPKISFIPHEEIFNKESVIVVRVPKKDMISRMKPGTVLICMLHYNTRPRLVTLLKERKIKSFSMDDMVDDWNNRIFVNYPGTSGPAIEIGFSELGKRMPYFFSDKRGPINATILGMGKVAQAAAKAFEICSDKAFINTSLPGVIVRMLPSTVTSRLDLLEKLLEDTDILVDCTKRKDPSLIVVPNRLLCALPDHAVIVDITSDHYDRNTSPPQVKAVEGIAYGTLDRYILEVDDPFYDTLSGLVDTTCRRVVVTCNAWPGYDPKGCMKLYEEQILPVLRVLFEKGPDGVDPESHDMYERALARSTLDHFLSN